jgi:VanZ family protein
VSSEPDSASLKPSFRDLARHWWPVAVWLVVIRLESTDYASSVATFGILYRIATAIFGRIDRAVLLTLNSVVRKSGHLIGYAILSWLVFLALKYTHRDRLKPVLQRRWGVFFRDYWQFDWALIAVLFTVITASLDEIHQSFIPSRTGQWQDVALDTAGAVLMQLLLYARASHSMSLHRKHATEEREPTLMH